MAAAGQGGACLPSAHVRQRGRVAMKVEVARDTPVSGR